MGYGICVNLDPMGQYGPSSPGNSGILGSPGNQESASYTFENPVSGSNLTLTAIPPEQSVLNVPNS
jgi:hypothetical protein